MSQIWTEIYAVAPGKYLGAIARSIMGRLWWLLLIPIIFFIAGFINWRWAAVGLIILMLMYPMTLTTALLSHALRPEVIRRSASRRASFEDDVITIYREEKISDETSVVFTAVESLKIIDLIPAGNLTKIVVGPKIFDFILIPTPLLPVKLMKL